MFCVVYQLCRVRGAKAVVRQMSHEAGELEPVIHALQAQVNETKRPSHLLVFVRSLEAGLALLDRVGGVRCEVAELHRVS